METINSHKDLIVWQKSMDLTSTIYTLTRLFPKDELFGITSQIRRAAVSIPSNIAEGRQRGGKREYARFLRIALGSVSEVETQILIAERLGLATKEQFAGALALALEITKMLKVMIKNLTRKQSS